MSSEGLPEGRISRPLRGRLHCRIRPAASVAVLKSPLGPQKRPVARKNSELPTFLWFNGIFAHGGRGQIVT